MSELPEGWAEAQLGSLGSWVSGATPSKSNATYWNGPIPWVSPKDVKSDFISDTIDHVSPAGIEAANLKVLPPGTLLFVVRGLILARAFPVALTRVPVTINQDLRALTPHPQIDPLYLFRALQYLSRNILHSVKEATHGTLRLDSEDLQRWPINIPPAAEQGRIIKKLEALLARVARAEERLASSDSRLHASKTSLLAAAFTGQIATDAANDTLEHEPLVKLAERFDYGTSAKSKRSGDVAVLRMGNINDGAIDWESLVYTSDTDEVEKYALMPGDVLFNRTNSPELVGKTAVYRGDRPAIHAGYLIRIRCGSKLLPDFLSLCLNSPAGRSWCHSVKTDGVSQSNISASKLKEFPVPSFSLEKQERIIEAHHELTRIVDAAKRRVRMAAAASVTMKQAMLAKSFTGELVITEAELARREHRRYEPASVLLEHIQGISGGTPVARGRR